MPLTRAWTKLSRTSAGSSTPAVWGCFTMPGTASRSAGGTILFPWGRASPPRQSCRTRPSLRRRCWRAWKLPVRGNPSTSSSSMPVAMRHSCAGGAPPAWPGANAGYWGRAHCLCHLAGLGIQRRHGTQWHLYSASVAVDDGAEPSRRAHVQTGPVGSRARDERGADPVGAVLAAGAFFLSYGGRRTYEYPNRRDPATPAIAPHRRWHTSGGGGVSA